MAVHLLGPVFTYEWLITSRRRRQFALRSGFITLLGAALALVWWNAARYYAFPDVRDLALAGESFFYGLVGTQLAIVLLAAPAATAGAVGYDRARGELLQLLATDLSGAEIVLGKLAARLVPVLGLLLCSLPVVLAASLLGGIAPDALLGAYAVTAGVAVLGCTLALVLSLRGTSAHEVLLVVYAAWVLLLLAPLMTLAAPVSTRLPALVAFFDQTEPFRIAFRPYLRPGTPCLDEQAYYLLACLGIAAALLLVAVFRVRAVVVRSQGRAALRTTRRAGRRWGLLPGPSLDENPVLWREWHRRRPSWWLRLVWTAYVVAALVFSALAVYERLTTNGWLLAPRLVNGVQVAVGLLLASVSSVTVLAQERAGGTLEVLLATPLSTRSIVWGKWWGAYRVMPRLAVLPVVVAGGGAVGSGHWLPVALLGVLVLAWGAALTSFGLALATRVRRPGTALGWAVGVTVFVIMVSFVVAELFMRGRPGSIVVASAGPFLSAVVLTICGEDDSYGQQYYGPALGWSLFWLVAYTVAAAALLAFTLARFNRCLGRMDERAARPKDG
jgi:ABC-type transport system involved in multi-copper enzyme maturation permease subunit